MAGALGRLNIDLTLNTANSTSAINHSQRQTEQISEYIILSNIVYFTGGEISSYKSSYLYVERSRSCSGIKVNDESEGEIKVCTKIVHGNIYETGNAVIFKKTNALGFELILAKTD
ncbi:hypothetical protein [Proteus sp. ZN5]|uniref:hypothetical protein n=1 Tax=Proteus sp. ZN5 TaxID=2697019 RepID=UPI0013E1A0C1|nr:hypothetical protein [Proteus sp. ZN5]QIG06474.1 hypothetical protein GTK47_14510 [Proteus sp. ZN5]